MSDAKHSRKYERRDLAFLQELARKNGGECLATEYLGMHHWYQWKCGKCGHIWETRPISITYLKTWCGKCGGTARKDVNYLHNLAQKRGGKCLSEEYINNKTKYKWQCEKLHTWEATANDIQRGRWCPYCSGKAPHDVNWLIELAKRRDGNLLSLEYKGIASKYTWQCEKLHTWEATAHDVSQGSWCPNCTPRYQETEVSDFIKELLPNEKVEGPKRGLIGGKFELDVYIPSRNLAIEYCGLYWHGESRGLDGARTRHANKLKRCQNVGIRLITIFSDEWMSRKEQSKGYLRAILDVGLTKIGARECRVEQCSPLDLKDFINQNHIQGYNGGSVGYIIKYRDEIVGGCVFSKSSGHGRGETVDGVWELSRYCVKLGYRIHGGLGKVLSLFKSQLNPKVIVSYSDKRWSVGNLYKSTGFTLEGEALPSYWYFKNGCSTIRYHKAGFKKSVLIERYGFDENLTEWEMAQLAGYDRIWDCGLDKWVWKHQSLM